VGARLELVELGAGATGAHELLVRAGLDHAPVLERDVAERAASHRTAIALVAAGPASTASPQAVVDAAPAIGAPLDRPVPTLDDRSISAPTHAD
jgi:hypothetical protein